MWSPSSTSAKTPKTATAAKSFRDTRLRVSRNDSELNLDLRAELDQLPCRYTEEGCRALGVVLQEREQGLAPHRHADDLFAWNDCLAADVVGDLRKIDAGEFTLFAGQLEPSCDRWILHEAEVKKHPRDALDQFDHLHQILVGDTRFLFDNDGEEQDALVHHVIVPDELRQRERHAVGRGCKKYRGTR